MNQNPLPSHRRAASEPGVAGMRNMLVLCVANSARNRMAEGLTRAVVPVGVAVCSAASSRARVRSKAVAALSEVGIDISRRGRGAAMSLARAFRGRTPRDTGSQPRPSAPASHANAGPTRPGRWRGLVPLLLLAAVVIVFAARAHDRQTPPRTPATTPAAPAAAAAGLPRLVDLGADRCIPCKAMAPILADLRREYAGRMQVDFIDVWKDPRAADPYRIYAIPTQIFFDAHGRELTRHEGFMSKDQILDTWARQGIRFERRAAPAAPR